MTRCVKGSEAGDLELSMNRGAWVDSRDPGVKAANIFGDLDLDFATVVKVGTPY